MIEDIEKNCTFTHNYLQTRKILTRLKKMGNRDFSIDIVKGIGIILMVIGHSGAPKDLVLLIYTFHMPLFFILSGYCQKDVQTIDLHAWLKKRVNRLMRPFYAWLLIFYVLRPLLFYAHFYSDYSEISNYHSVTQFLYGLTRIFVMFPEEPILGTFWFLPVLLFSSFLSLFLLKRYESMKSIITILIGGFILISIAMSYVCNKILHHEVYLLTSVPFASCFYLTGIFIRRHVNVEKSSLLVTPVLLLAVMVSWKLYSGNMNYLSYIYVAPYFISAVAGSFLLMKASKFLEKKNFMSPIIYIGKNSLDIMIWHFLAFKLISFIMVEAVGLPIDLVGMHPVIQRQGTFWWILYVVVGVTLPLLIAHTIRTLNSSANKMTGRKL